ncbi:hypothetical protein [Clostridium estertheticum]|uniref:hypothetical protein n=1 Tax=Clostridium estertheticum TaxID=238834 RepID=UPI000B1E5665|nr:hypothetical protein [Clostridium estertheticum]MBZ9615163.1 hypothetical protein [Clostridium estertheticum subsp. laramiense]WAG75057.1 hypothetical protein LL032_06290 [Clostridium estertheticum]
MESINSKISRTKLYKGIYEPCESIRTEKVCEDSNVNFYDEASKLLTLMYLAQRKEC